VKDGVVVHSFGVLQISGAGCSLKPAVQFRNTTLADMGFADIFLLKRSDGTLVFGKGAATLQLWIPLLLDVAKIGEEVKMDEGMKKDTQLKVRAIMSMESKGVAGMPATIGATLCFILQEHAPVAPVAAAAAGGE
jgi:hypothetical protein